MDVLRNILKTFSSNFIYVLVGIITGFLLPTILDIDQYAYLKTFTLYVSYVGFLHFGFVDGLYIKYGGKNLIDLNREILKSEHNFLVIFQLAITLIIASISLVIKDYALLIFSLSILPLNLQSFYKLIYQATGEFSKYVKINNLSSLLNIIMIVVLVAVIKAKHYMYYVLGYLLVYFIVFVYLDFDFNQYYKDVKVKKIKEITKNNFKVGIFILLGNLSTMIFYAIDRWVIKFALPIEDFAYYSFAVSMLNILNVVINSVSMTLYNYLAKNEDRTFINLLKKYFLIIGVMASGGYFIFEAIVNIFIKKFIPSLSIIAILFAAYPYMIVINALYVNLYKARKKERLYLKTVIYMVILAFLLNIISLFFGKSSDNIAFATLISFIVWYIYSMKHFNFLKNSLKENAFLILSNVVFLYLSNYLSWYSGILLYYVFSITLSFILFKGEIKYIIIKIMDFRLKKRG